MPSSEVLTRDHRCVALGGDADLRSAASRHLSEGLTAGEQVGFYGWGTRDALQEPLAGLGDVDELMHAGAAQARSLEERFRHDEPPDPAALVAYWADATEAALAAGFAGLRVVADTTPWAGLGHEQRSVFLQGEQLVNRYRHRKPFTLVCACHTPALPAEALEETASIHPSAEGVSTPFCLHATHAADLALEGEVDAYGVPLLERLLGSMPPSGADGRLVVDASGLRFIEHRSLLALERHAERTDLGAVVLRNAPQVVGRITRLLELRRVRWEGAA